MQDTLSFEPVRHTDFVLIVEGEWDPVALGAAILVIAAAALAAWAWIRTRRRRRQQH